MTSEPLLDPDLAQLLRANRRRVVPFAGAGVTASAGFPTARQLAITIGEQAQERGAKLTPRSDFDGVCGEVSDQLGHDELQRIVSEIIGAAPVEPTPLLARIAHAPSQIVVTTNYDYGLEAAAHEIGREPVTLHPRSALVTAAPMEGQLLVVHIHGVHDEPESIILPGRSVQALQADDPFKTALRMLLAPHFILYLGYSFPGADDYLRSEIEWIRDNLTDTGEHALLLPEDEYEARREDLDALGASVRIFTFDASRSYDAVQQAALTIAPSREVVATRVERIVGSEVVPDFATPPILRDEIDGESEKRNTRAMMARLGMGEDRFIEPRELLEAGRSLVIAEPGMGKTQLLLHLGGIAFGFAPLYVPAKSVSEAAAPERDSTTALALALARQRPSTTQPPFRRSRSLHELPMRF
jgi:SIR2-like domain